MSSQAKELTVMDQGNIKRFAKEIRKILDRQERQIIHTKNLLNRIAKLTDGDQAQ